MVVRTPNKVSVRRVVLLIIFLVLLSLIVSCCIIIHKGEGFYEYETQDEIKTVFKENIDEFDRYVEMFRHHDMWRKFYDETHDKDVVTYKGFKKYTTRMNIIFWNSLIRNIILGFGNLAGSFSPLTEAICQYINTKKAINRLNSNYTEPKSIIGPSSIMRIGYS